MLTCRLKTQKMGKEMYLRLQILMLRLLHLSFTLFLVYLLCRRDARLQLPPWKLSGNNF